MSKETRTEANQANAQHSTGLKTPEGKQRSSRKALRHGLTSQIALMPTEDREAYQSHLKSFADEYHPQGATEANLVQALADTAWRLNRIVALEANLLTSDASFETQSKSLANLSLYSQRLSRQFERTVAQLREMGETRRAQGKKDLSDVIDIVEMYQDKGEDYQPSADGFVFSERQINKRIHACNRERTIEEASDYLKKQAA